MSDALGIDLGTATTIIYSKNRGIILEEPSAVAVDLLTNEPIAFGKTAKNMLGRTANTIKIVMPISEGVVSNYTLTLKMLKFFLKRADYGKFLPNKVMVCVPANVSTVQRTAIEDVVFNCGARNVSIIEEPVAAAIGAGIDVNKTKGNLIVDIGGGTTDIAIIANGTTVVSRSILTAGNTFNDEIKKYISEKYNMEIGDLTAEDIKQRVGCVYPHEHMEEIECRGKNLNKGIPMELKINSAELEPVLEKNALKIVEAIKEIIEKTPPEIMENVMNKGIYLTGGGSKLSGIAKLVGRHTGIETIVAQDAEKCVAIGTGKAITNTYSAQEE